MSQAQRVGDIHQGLVVGHGEGGGFRIFGFCLIRLECTVLLLAYAIEMDDIVIQCVNPIAGFVCALVWLASILSKAFRTP